MTTPTHFEADLERLTQFARDNAQEYAQAAPFPHAIIDNFARPEVMQAVLEEFEVASASWAEMNDQFQCKFAANRTLEMGPATRALIQFLNGQEIIGFLEELTGIKGLIPDPQLAGGGMHELRQGGFLNVHADFNYQKSLKLDRRINLLLYLNKDWDASWGGNISLWDRTAKNQIKSYTPDFNRCAIFNTNDWSFHGNPEPISAPLGRARRSIAMYYYTNGRPEGEVSAEHMTIFKKRPHELSVADATKSLLHQVTPPVLFQAWRKVRGKYV